MKALSNRLGFTLSGILTGTIAMMGTTACSSDSGNGNGGNNDKSAGGSGTSKGGGNNNAGATGMGDCQTSFTISFNPMYSAFIDGGSHTFQIPAIANGVSA